MTQKQLRVGFLSLVALVISLFISSSWNAYRTYSHMPYTVMDIKNYEAEKRTGKHSSEILNRTYILIRYTDGYEETKVVDDPFRAQEYEVGQTYISNTNFFDCCFRYGAAAIIGSVIIFLLCLTIMATAIMLFGFCIAWAFGISDD